MKPHSEGGILDASALPFPLDTIYYIRLTADYNSQNAQISGENFVQNNQIKMLDKLWGLWYNGNSGRVERKRPAKSQLVKLREVGISPHLLFILGNEKFFQLLN